MIRYTIIILFVSALSFSSLAQDYSKAFGYKWGNFTNFMSGFSLKKLDKNEEANEIVLNFNYGGMRIAFNHLYHKPAFWQITDKLFWYYGFGFHAGFFNNYEPKHYIFQRKYPINKMRMYGVIGFNNTIGIEYRLIRFPFVASLEYTPYFDLYGPGYFDMNISEVNMCIKYTF